MVVILKEDAIQLYVNGVQIQPLEMILTLPLQPIYREQNYIGKSVCCPEPYLDGIIEEFSINEYIVEDNYIQCFVNDICNVDFCQTCIKQIDRCKTCKGNRILGEKNGIQNQCICPEQTLYGQNDTCQACEFQCQKCESNINNCTECVVGRLLENQCKCPRGFYDDGIDLTCLSCDTSCARCDKDQCFECSYNKYNHNPGTDKTCDCLGPNQIDHTGITEYCTNCNTIVFKKIQFSSDFLTISIEFYDEIIIRNTLYNIRSLTKDFCISLFETETQNKLGQGSQCILDENDILITIKLGINPTITINDYLEFKQQIIQRKVCLETEFIDNFYENYLVLNNNPNNLQVNFSKLGESISLCQDIQISINSIKNDGKRGLFNFIWNLESTTSTNTQKIDQILNDNTLNSLDYLIIPAFTLQAGSDYAIKVTCENFFQQQSQQLFNFLVLQEQRGISASIIQTRPFVFLNYKKNEIEAIVQFLDCSNGQFTTVEKSFNITWIDETDINNPIKKLNILTEPDQQIIKYVIDKYTQTPGQKYNYQLNIQVPDESIQQNLYFLYEIKQNQLIAYIEGGNRLQSYSKSMSLEAKGYDPDVSIDQQEIGILKSWNCIDMGNQTPCETIIGDPIAYSNTNSLFYQEKLFEPYSSLQFFYNITKTGKDPQFDTALIIVVEIDLPQLTISVPESFQTQKINQNDDLQVTIDTNENPDEVFFSLIFLYKFEVVATKSFYYNKMAFKIWDIYSQFDTNESQLQLRVSLYNPQFFMPSQSNFNINLNFEPQQGSIQIIPTQGISMETDFLLILDGFIDEDLPLSYKYQYYLLEQDYLNEIQNGVKQLKSYKNILTDFSNINKYQTKLPQGQYNENNNNYDLLIMVSVSDSLGAIKNITQIINVQPSNNNFDSILNNYQTQINNLNQLQLDNQISYLNLLTTQLIYMGQNDCKNQCSQNGLCKTEKQQKYCECFEGYYLQDCSQNQFQDQYSSILKQVYDELQIKVDQTNSQAIKDQILKSINLILESSQMSYVMEYTELQQNFDQQNKNILEQKLKLNELINSGQLYQGDNIVSTKYSQIIDLLSKNLENVNSSIKNLNNMKLRRRSNESQEQILQNLLIEISKNTTQIIQTAILPNSEPIQFQGSQLNIKAQKLTNKRMEKEYSMEDNTYVYYDFDDNQEENNQNTQDGDNTQQNDILNTSQYDFKQNPFIKDSEFPYSQQDNGLRDLDIKNQDSLEDQDIEIKSPVNLRFSSKDNSQNEQCITRNKSNQKWYNEYCETQEKENDKGEKQINCECKTLEPATVIDDIDNLFENSVVSSVYSDQGLSSLKSFKFWESIIFYIILIKTIVLSIIMVIGYYIDKKQLKQINNEKILKEDQSQKALNNKQIHPLSYIQTLKGQNYEDDSLKQNSKIKTSNQNQKIQKRKKEQEEFKNLNQISTQQLDLTQEHLQQNQEKKQQQDLQSQEKQQDDQISVLYDIDNQQNNSLKTIELQSQHNNQQNKNFSVQSLQQDDNSKSLTKQNSLDNQQEQCKSIFSKPIEPKQLKPVSEGIIRFHEFFSIFYILDEKISRPVRFAIYYQKITILIAFSGLFSQNTTQLQSIYLSIVSPLIIILPMKIIVSMYKSSNFIIKTCSIILLIAIQLIITYTILVTAAVMGIEESNTWVLSYSYTFVINFFVIVPIQISIILNIIRYGLLKGKKIKLINEKTQAKMIEFLYPNYK